MAIEVIDKGLDFSELHTRMQWYVDEEIIPCCSTLIMQGTEVVDLSFHGPIEHQTNRPLKEDTIFRMHSCTKIVTSIAAMILHEEGKFALDDPLEAYLPEFGNMQVLKADAASIDDVEPATGAIKIKHILSHTAGFSYGFVEPTTIIDRAYTAANINPFAFGSSMTLGSLCASLSELPLAFQPGSFWRYSLATDVTARLIEVLSGQVFDNFLQERIFKPLKMLDTDFYVPPDKQHRFVTMYTPINPLDPMSSGYTIADDPHKGIYSKPVTFLSGGGGLTSTLVDYLALVRMILSGGSYQGQQIIKPETLATMRTNQCAAEVHVNFPLWDMAGTDFGLGFALKSNPGQDEPARAADEYHWGGLAGTHLWMAPRANLAGICMTQNMPAFWHPFSHDFKRFAYAIAG